MTAMTLLTQPTVEPVLLAEIKMFSKIEITDTDVPGHDAFVTSLGKSARRIAENILRRALITQQWQIALDSFPEGNKGIILPYPKLQTIDEIKYVAPDGTLTLWPADQYAADALSEPAWIMPAYGVSWPATRAVMNAVLIKQTVGYGADGSFVPEDVKVAIKMLTQHLFVNRDLALEVALKTVPMSVDAILWPYRVLTF